MRGRENRKISRNSINLTKLEGKKRLLKVILTRVARHWQTKADSIQVHGDAKNGKLETVVQKVPSIAQDGSVVTKFKLQWDLWWWLLIITDLLISFTRGSFNEIYG